VSTNGAPESGRQGCLRGAKGGRETKGSAPEGWEVGDLEMAKRGGPGVAGPGKKRESQVGR
jgi:hypothetical protein